MSSDDLDQIAARLEDQISRMSQMSQNWPHNWAVLRSIVADALRHQREVAFAEMEIALQEIEHDHAATETKLADALRHQREVAQQPTVKEGHYSVITDVPTLRRMVERSIDDLREAMELTDETRAKLAEAQQQIAALSGRRAETEEGR